MLVKNIIQEPLDIHTNMTMKEKDEKVFWLLDKVGLSKEQALDILMSFLEVKDKELVLQDL